MDHLTPCKTQQDAEIEVPYLCGGLFDEEIQTMEDFVEYPTTAGFGLDGSLEFGDCSDERKAAFLQNWLYFGLLNMYLTLQDMEFDKSSFVTLNSNGEQIITSMLLPSLLDEWHKKERSRNDTHEAREARFDRLKQALTAVRYQITHQSEIIETPVPLVLASVQALAFSIVLTAKERWNEYFLGLSPSFGKNHVLSQRLSENGWCPLDVEILLRNLFMDAQYFSTTMDVPRRRYSHENCSAFECKVMNIDESTYRTQHVTPNCECLTIEVPLEPLHNLVDDFQIPYVRYTSQVGSIEAGALEIVQVAESDPNVVFSHVWSDGLGSTSGKNDLPCCQLSRLQAIANATYRLSTTEAVPFYIDTLCVPRNLRLRRKAIRNMRHIYKKAGTVVVLDKDIESISTNDGWNLISMTILFSGWMHRLWTYQEGALNPSLHFKLSNAVIPFELLKGWTYATAHPSQGWERLPGTNSVALTTLSYMTNILEILDLESVPPLLSLAGICDALQPRSTSWKDDEAIVLSTLLGFDPEVILETEGNQRMKAFFVMLRKVPAALMLLSGDRMEEHGYRWAPRSLLSMKRSDDVNPLRLWYSRMLKLNAGRGFTNEDGVGEVLYSGALRLDTSGFAIFPQRSEEARITSPFWTTEFVGMHPDGLGLMMQDFRRFAFKRDQQGMPEDLPATPFLVVVIEPPRPITGDFHTKMDAVIVIPEDDMVKAIKQNFFDPDFGLGTIICRFHCRVTIELMSPQLIHHVAGWREEIFGEDGIVNAECLRAIGTHEWIIS